MPFPLPSSLLAPSSELLRRRIRSAGHVLGDRLLGMGEHRSRAVALMLLLLTRLPARPFPSLRTVRSLRSLTSDSAPFTDLSVSSSFLSTSVAAGIVIAQEAGGRIFGGAKSDLTADCSAELVTGRKYLIIRGIPEGKEGQQSLAREFYEHVVEWDQA